MRTLRPQSCVNNFFLLITTVATALWIVYFFNQSYFLDGGFFPDRANYDKRLLNIASRGPRYGGPGLLPFFAGEPGWEWLSDLVVKFDVPSKYFYFLISAACLSAVIYFVASHANLFFGIFVALNPIMIDMALSQLRSAAAMAMLLLAMLTARRWLKAFWVTIVISFHFGFIIPIIVYFITEIGLKNLPLDRVATLVATILVGAISGAVFSLGVDFVLSGLGDRRLGYAAAGAPSLTYLLPWLVLAAAAAFYGIKTESRLTSIATAPSVQYPVLLIFAVVVAAWGGFNLMRLVAVAMPVLAVHLWLAKAPVKYLLPIGFLFLQAVQLVFWASR